MKDEIKETYGSMIKELRVKNGLTQCEVAKALNVTPGYISHVENNRTAMSLRILIFYAKTIGISLDALVGQLESDYTATAIDNEILSELTTLREAEKVAMLQTIKLWKNVQ